MTRSTPLAEKTSDPPIPAPWPADQVERRPVADLIPYARNARRHRASQIAEIAASIREWGWTMPALIDETDEIIAGHGRVLAARQLGITDIPVVVARDWTEAQKRAYRLADNEITLHGTWNTELLRVELADLRDQGVDLELMGFAASDALGHQDMTADELPQALQLQPAREYAVIMCDGADEWERLKEALSLTPVRRGGYKKGSPFDDVGTQRVVKAADLFSLLDAHSCSE
ncbi:MAG TPA: ParB/Srx family N-terminal domain-containing protein [Xanthobacteraceae bacterium]|nr:ParB/Srx family N-terminal domain-containing protein [Xanthobacteraceae bacterium]